jgi:RNA polymerase subunit RPABC4/transcription elongation factor Spt4
MIRLTEIVDCPECLTPFEGEWVDDSVTLEDMDSAPTAAQTCPFCGEIFTAEYSGWTMYNEAG